MKYTIFISDEKFSKEDCFDVRIIDFKKLGMDKNQVTIVKNIENPDFLNSFPLPLTYREEKDDIKTT